MIDPSIAILGWIAVSVFLFVVVSPVRAVTLAYLGGWLLLPTNKVEVSGFPDIDKILATSIGVLLGTMVFCPERIRGFKINVADLLILAYCGSGFAASMTNDLGLHDGVSRFTELAFTYGAPYLAGRLFIKTTRDLYQAARTVVAASALYSLPAVWEWRMSPEFHSYFYGSFQHSWYQHARWGHWRPVVFFPHALGLGTFFMWTALLGLWLYLRGGLKQMSGIPGWIVVAGPAAGLAVSMSFGPWGLFVAGVALLLMARKWRAHWAMAVPVVLAAGWMVARYVPVTDGKWLIDSMADLSVERAESLAYRINAEDELIEHAKKQPVFGWGTWGRNRLHTDDGRVEVATDGLWVIVVGTSGMVGLVSFFAWWCWPILMGVVNRHPVTRDPTLTALLMAIGLQAVNLLFNAFLSPILTLMCGSAITLIATPPRPARARAAHPGSRTLPASRMRPRQQLGVRHVS